MIAPLAALLRLHELNVESQSRGGKQINRTEVSRLLQALTPAVVDRYKRLYHEHGEEAVVPLRRGVCCGCHRRQPAMLHSVEDDIYVCENCGRLLYLPDVAYELYVG